MDLQENVDDRRRGFAKGPVKFEALVSGEFDLVQELFFEGIASAFAPPSAQVVKGCGAAASFEALNSFGKGNLLFIEPALNLISKGVQFGGSWFAREAG
jgi:hypothetical protein